MQETICPECGCHENYTLKDGRLQCAGCRKKFTAETHRAKLTPHAFGLIAGSFWGMIPASAAAAELGLNCKTLQKYYHQLRCALAQTSQSRAVELFGASTVDAGLFHDLALRRGEGRGGEPLFCLARDQERISLLFAATDGVGDFTGRAPPELLGWVYAQNIEALQSLDLDRIRFLSSAEAKDDPLGRPFWIHAKRNLVKYHGGFRKNFLLFVYEMEFRFNNHDEDTAAAWLKDILLNA